MDIGRFQANLSKLIGAKLLNTSGSDVEQIKRDSGLAGQTGPAADTVEINFGMLTEMQNSPGNADIAAIVNNVSQMTPEQAQAALNPDVITRLVQAGILE